jgi:2-oxo-3-hexenedioate decarboxylase
MNPDAIAAHADEMVRLHDACSLATPFSQRGDEFTVADAYAVSRELLRRREEAGWRRVGRKIGFTNRTIWEQYQVFEPIFGYMYDRTTHWVNNRTWDVDGHGPEGSVSLAGLSQPLVEPEVVFRLRETPPVTDDPEALLRCIDWVGHGFEIVQCHFPDWKFAVADTIADGGLHGRYVFGHGRPIGRDEPISELVEQLSTFRVRLIKNGSVVATGGGDLVLGSPLNALAYLVKTLASLPDHPPLQAGEFVTTGTLTTALPTVPGDTWFCRFDGVELVGLVMRCEG